MIARDPARRTKNIVSELQLIPQRREDERDYFPGVHPDVDGVNYKLIFERWYHTCTRKTFCKLLKVPLTVPRGKEHDLAALLCRLALTY